MAYMLLSYSQYDRSGWIAIQPVDKNINESLLFVYIVNTAKPIKSSFQ